MFSTNKEPATVLSVYIAFNPIQSWPLKGWEPSILACAFASAKSTDTVVKESIKWPFTTALPGKISSAVVLIAVPAPSVWILT